MHIETIPVKIGGDPFFTTNCYLVSATPESDCVIVIDPGDEPELILEHIGSRSPAAILLTHGHFDHIGGVAGLAEATGAPSHVQEKDAYWIEEHFDEIRNGYANFAQRMNARKKDAQAPVLSEEVPRIDYALLGGNTVEFCGLSFLVLPTPGHTPGSICLYNAEDGILFSGDTLFKGTCGRTDFMGGDPASMHDSLALLAKLPPETVVYPGHDATTTIGAEINRGLSEY